MPECNPVGAQQTGLIATGERGVIADKTLRPPVKCRVLAFGQAYAGLGTPAATHVSERDCRVAVAYSRDIAADKLPTVACGV